MKRLVVVVLLVWTMCGCGGTSNSVDAVGDGAGGDSQAPVPADVAADASGPGDVGPDAPDTADIAADETAAPSQRTWHFRGMGGASMGAAAFTYHVHNPGHLDFVAALGGYINFHYLQDFFLNMMFAGFCDLEMLLAHPEELNNADSAVLQCGPVTPRHPWEWPVDFNHFHFDTQGVTTDRDFIIWVMEGMFTAHGNLAYYNPDHPFLPPGVPVSWADWGSNAEKCANPVHVGKPNNYNAEYNPEGEYDLITFCDGEEPVPGGKENPEWWDLMGVYDPEGEHNRPVHILLAVDLNGNGLRDYHEPIAINAVERYLDLGADGCDDGQEDGTGGCAGGGEGEDPNGDNYHLVDNPFGLQGNGLWDEGEPFDDYGLDGVAGTGDYGEEDGQYNRNPRLQALLDSSPMAWIDEAPQADLEAVDILLDGGIRDVLHALTATWPLYSHLRARVADTRAYHGYTEFEDSLYPVGESTPLLLAKDDMDWSAEALGRNFIVRYGDPDATAEEILAGDGKHLGTDMDLMNRLAVIIMLPLYRWPDLDWEVCKTGPGKTMYRTFYSESLKNRYGYGVSTPPCYHDVPAEHPGFPVVVYLPGHGMDAGDTIAGAIPFNIMAQSGDLPKFILVVPEGQCCSIDKETGTRYCVCRKNEENGDMRDCLDPTCKGPEESCDIIPVHKDNLVQECNGGHFYTDQVSDVFGNVENVEEMRYEGLLNDLLEDLDANFKTRAAETW